MNQYDEIFSETVLSTPNLPASSKKLKEQLDKKFKTCINNPQGKHQGCGLKSCAFNGLGWFLIVIVVGLILAYIVWYYLQKKARENVQGAVERGKEFISNVSSSIKKAVDMGANRVQNAAQIKVGQANVVDNSNLVKQLVGANKPSVLMAFADWCGHCNRAMPQVLQAAKQSNVPFVLVSDDVLKSDPSLANGLNIKGFPSIMKVGNNVQVPYSGDRSADSLVSFANQN